jgi:alpha-mannosidase
MSMSAGKSHWTVCKSSLIWGLVVIAGLALPGEGVAQAVSQKAASLRSSTRATDTRTSDLTKQPALYVVGYAHLDTEWRWEYPQTISEYLPKTMHLNFDLFQKYPHYIFNFSGANRYRMMKEYFPADYEQVKKYVAEGRWYPAGSSMEEGDVNSPSPESIIRQVLYGNTYFRHEFGKASAEYMLPDCFGFPASLPSILHAAGVKAFSTQKLTWGSSAPVGGLNSPEDTPEGTPFNVGIWTGPDGHGVLAALNPGKYASTIHYDLSKSLSPSDAPGSIDWPKRLERDGKAAGIYADYRYYGTGDRGGAPDETSVKIVEAIVTKGVVALPPAESDPRTPDQAQAVGPEVRVGDGPLHIVSSRADQMFLDILKQRRTSRLPTYTGDLELTNHSAGSLTSQTIHKQWNWQNEILADAGERASVAAAWLGGRLYPLDRLNNAWALVMGGQFHDIMAGTATPKAYEFIWNDDVIAMNQFAGVLTSATQAISSGLDTQAKGTPVVVYNPLDIEREDVAEARVAFPGGVPNAVRVCGPDGKEVAAQIEDASDHAATILFLAKVPSVGFATYDIQSSDSPAPPSTLQATASRLENARYRIRLDESGDVASIYDKQLARELLSAPLRLAFQTEKPEYWPAWNMDWADQERPARNYVQGPAKVTVAESGPVRAAVRVEREAEGSKFVETIRLSAGDAGNRVEFANAIDWRSKEAALKAVFPLTTANPEATYNWGAGTIKRGNNDPKKFEVAAHSWFDLTDKSGANGVTILSGSKTGSDKPDDRTLRLTLIYTPGISEAATEFADQASQDWGHHEFIYGLVSHAGDWRKGGTDWQAIRLDQPLLAFQTSGHAGALGKSFSFLKVNSSHIRVMAVKKAEDSDEIVVRIVEMRGDPAPEVRISFAGPVTTAREIDGQEQPLGNARVTAGELVTSLGPYEIRSFALRMAAPRIKLAAPQSLPVDLKYDLAVATDEGAKSRGGIDATGNALPAEMLPGNLDYNGIRFHLGPAWAGEPNAVVARGQTVSLPPGDFNRLYILAASAEGDQKAVFRVGDQPVELGIQDWGGFVGQWDVRTWRSVELPLPSKPSQGDNSPYAQRVARLRAYAKEHGPIMIPECDGLKPGYIKGASIAWFASHHHTAGGASEPYSYSYLFAYPIDLTPGTKTLTLPDNDKIRILAVTVAQEPVAGTGAPPGPHGR